MSQTNRKGSQECETRIIKARSKAAIPPPVACGGKEAGPIEQIEISGRGEQAN
jgi:hypothetical protein